MTDVRSQLSSVINRHYNEVKPTFFESRTGNLSAASTRYTRSTPVRNRLRLVPGQCRHLRNMVSSDESTLFFIELIRDRPCLYDHTHPNYKDNATVKRSNWIDIARQYGEFLGREQSSMRYMSKSFSYLFTRQPSTSLLFNRNARVWRTVIGKNQFFCYQT
mgnify:CR=1 FL=1